MMMTGRTRAPPTEEPAQPLSPEIDTEADYKSAFQTFSPSLNGSITTAQFRQAMADLGETVTDAELEEVMENIDGDEKISCEKLTHIIPSSSTSSCFPLLQFWKRKEMNADDVGYLQTGSLSILQKVNKAGLMIVV